MLYWDQIRIRNGKEETMIKAGLILKKTGAAARTIWYRVLGDATEWDFLQNPSEEGGVFSSLIDKVKEIGASGYQLLMIVGIIGLAMSIIMTVISLLFFTSPQKKEEKKSHVVTICVCGIALFSVFSIIGFFKSIGSGL